MELSVSCVSLVLVGLKIGGKVLTDLGKVVKLG